jgi:5-methylcytosine-specific restriction endonuclease McrA
MSVLLKRKVLVLNKTYSPVGIVGLKRAIKLLFSIDDDGHPKAYIIDPTQDFAPFSWSDWADLRPLDGEDAIKGVNITFRVPEIIRLKNFNKLPQQRIHFNRRAIYKRDGNNCQYCHQKFSTNLLSIDHIVPRSKGGLTVWSNCILTCLYCNMAKADYMPKKTGDIYTVFFQSGSKRWSVEIKEPEKPAYNFFSEDDGSYCNSWKSWISTAYWNCELENDNRD